MLRRLVRAAIVTTLLGSALAVAPTETRADSPVTITCQSLGVHEPSGRTIWTVTVSNGQQSHSYISLKCPPGGTIVGPDS